MGITCRVFFLDDNDSLQRISMARLDRLLHFDRRESFQQYAGKRVRCAMVFLEVDGRQVLSIRNIDYCLPRGMGEKPSPLGEDFSKLAVWNIIVDRAIPFTI